LLEHRIRRPLFDAVLWVAIVLACVYFEVSLMWLFFIVPIWVGLRVRQLAASMRE